MPAPTRNRDAQPRGNLDASRERHRLNLGINSEGSTPKARASFSIVSSVADRCARSMNETAVRCRPASKPSCSWDTPRAVRSSRTRSPKSLANRLRFTGRTVAGCVQLVYIQVVTMGGHPCWPRL